MRKITAAARLHQSVAAAAVTTRTAGRLVAARPLEDMAAVMVTEGARASHRLLKCKNAAVHGRALRNCSMTPPSRARIVRRSLVDIGPLRFHRSLHRSRLRRCRRQLCRW